MIPTKSPGGEEVGGAPAPMEASAVATIKGSVL